MGNRLMSARSPRLMGRRAERRAAEARRTVIDAAWAAYLATAPGTDAAELVLAAVVVAERAA